MIDPGVRIILDAVRARGIDGDYRDLGMIRTQRYGDLLIFNYTQQAQYSRTWNPVERVARGLIIDAAKCEVVALPFPKFFNLGETAETSMDAIAGLPFEATVKVDGSLGIIYHGPDGWAVATRGSFTGEQAVWATAFLRKHHTDWFEHVGVPMPGLTLLVEIVYPENRIVLDYGRDERLVLIGAREFRRTGELHRDLPYQILCNLASMIRMPVVEPAGSILSDLLTGQADARGIEGWVLRFDDGLRVKVKTQQYIELHRAIFGLTPERIREALVDGAFADLDQALPEELQPGARATADCILAACADEERRIRDLFTSVRSMFASDAPRGDLARYVVANHPNDRAHLFSLLDNRSITAGVLKGLDLDVVLPEDMVKSSQ